jgi:hypothetical protein
VSRYTADFTNALTAPDTGETPAIEEACAAAYPGWACSDFVDTHNIPQACRQVSGTVPLQTVCGFSSQCVTSYCALVEPIACGSCYPLPDAGSSCATTECPQGLSCTTDTMDCVVVGGQGASCGTGAPCGEQFYCVGANDSMNVMGTCQQALTQLGAACDPTSAKGPGCDHTQFLTCNAMTKQCATMTLGAAGQPCGTNDVNNQTVLCSALGTCTGATTGVPGMCVSAVADGMACDSVNGPGCMELSQCIPGGAGGSAGTCALPSAATCLLP